MRPLSGGFRARDHSEQGRLPRAVRADDPDDRSRGDAEGQAVDEQAVPVSLGHVLEGDDEVSQPRARGDGDLLLVPDLFEVLPEQVLVGVDAGFALGLAGLGRHADPFELAGQRPLPAALGLLLHGQAGALLLEPGRVVALPGDAHAPVELEDPAGDVVQEIAVVGHGDDRALVFLEMALEPGHGFGVEMVRRLVQEEDVRLHEQEAR